MKTSFRNLVVFDQSAGGYLAKHKDETKLSYAINRILGEIRTAAKKFNEDWQETLQDIQIDHCLTDPPGEPNGKVLRDSEGRYVFTRESEKACKKAAREARDKAMDKSDVEIAPYFATLVPEDLSDEELEAFKGFVVRPEQVESMLQAREAGEASRLAAVPDTQAA